MCLHVIVDMLLFLINTSTPNETVKLTPLYFDCMRLINRLNQLVVQLTASAQFNSSLSQYYLPYFITTLCLLFSNTRFSVLFLLFVFFTDSLLDCDTSLAFLALERSEFKRTVASSQSSAAFIYFAVYKTSQ